MADALFLLIFAVVPTAFLYVVAYAIIAGVGALVLGRRKGLLVGAFLVLGTAIGIPLAANRAVTSRLATEPPGDRRPAEPLTIEGDVLVGNPGQFRTARTTDGPWLCQEICSLLLATPGVRTVTVTDRDQAASFAVSANADCTIDPLADFRDRGVLVWENRRNCLQVIPLVRQHDYSVETEGDQSLRTGIFPVADPGALPERPMVTIVRASIGSTLIQVTQRRMSKIVTPLSFCWTLDLHDNKGFCASETSDLSDQQRLPHRLVLADLTNVPNTRAVRSTSTDDALLRECPKGGRTERSALPRGAVC